MASVGHVALALATALSWLGLGSLLLAKLRDVGDVVLDALNRVAAGAVAWALLTAFAGWAGALYTWVYLVAFIPCAVVGVAAALTLARTVPRPHPSRWPLWHRALGALLAVYGVFGVVSTLAPISSEDALRYHAAGPALFEHAHRLIQMPWAWESYQPFSVEMLTLDGFLLWDPIQGALPPLLLGIAATAAVGGVAYRLRGRGEALLAAAIFGAQPFFLWESSSTFVEPALALVVALACWNLWRLRTTGLVRFACLAGVFAGAGAGMKYVGAGAGVGIAIAALVLVRERVRLATVAAFAVPAILVPLPWYVKNAVLTGNPIYPLIFGGASPEADAAIRANLRHYGRGHGILDALLVPFRFLTSGNSFDRGDFVSPLLLGLPPLALLVQSARRTTLVAFGVSFAYCAVWFVDSQQARFLVPLFPAFAIAAAVGAFTLAERGRAGRLLVVTLTSGALLAGLAISGVYTSQFVPYLLGRQSQSAFLSQKSSNYDGVAWLNAHVPSGVILSDIGPMLYLRPPYLTDTADTLPRSAGPEAVRQLVRCRKIDYIALLRRDVTFRAQMRPVLGQFIGATSTHLVLSRTRNTVGPGDEMLVYRVVRPLGPTTCDG